MFQRKPRSFRQRSNGRSYPRHPRSNGQTRHGSDSFSNGQRSNKFRPTQSAEKLLEKYTTLAKEAMSSGEKTLSENYLQHADHYVRVIDDKNKIRAQNKVEDKPLTENKILSQSDTSNEDQSIEKTKE